MRNPYLDGNRNCKNIIWGHCVSCAEYVTIHNGYGRYSDNYRVCGREKGSPCDWKPPPPYCWWLSPDDDKGVKKFRKWAINHGVDADGLMFRGMDRIDNHCSANQEQAATSKQTLETQHTEPCLDLPDGISDAQARLILLDIGRPYCK